MQQYIPLQAVLDRNYITNAIKKETDPDTLLSYALDGLRLLNLSMTYQSSICIRPIINHIVTPPSGIHTLEMLTYLPELPEDLISSSNLLPISTDSTYNIYYQLWYLNTAESNKYFPLRNVGNSSSINCMACNNPDLNRCAETFSILPSGDFMVSIKEGYVVINYSSEIKDEEGNFLIPKSVEVLNFLGLYATSKALLERSMSKEEQVFSMYKQILAQTEIAFRKARGITMLKNLNISEIDQITGTDTYNQRLIRSGNDFYKKYATNG
jgi:hypothetical protein